MALLEVAVEDEEMTAEEGVWAQRGPVKKSAPKALNEKMRRKIGHHPRAKIIANDSVASR